MNTTNYNGWANYETWNVKLWIDNDEGSSDYWAEVATELLHYRHHNTQEQATYQLAKQLETEITDAAPDLGASCYAHILNAALRKVNWNEIAQSMIQDAKERVAA